MSNKRKRPERDEYYIRIAMAVRARANCQGNHVGAILVRGDRIIATGYNGTPTGMANCEEGGCERCDNRERFPSGQYYDVCICVHAEQNAILAAAKHGIATQDATLYSTMRPCFGCLKELVQAGIERIVYLHDWTHKDSELWEQYLKLEAVLKYPVEILSIPDPEEEWAVSKKREVKVSAD